MRTRRIKPYGCDETVFEITAKMKEIFIINYCKRGVKKRSMLPVIAGNMRDPAATCLALLIGWRPAHLN